MKPHVFLCPNCLNCLSCGRSMASELEERSTCDHATGPGHEHVCNVRAPEWERSLVTDAA